MSRRTISAALLGTCVFGLLNLPAVAQDPRPEPHPGADSPEKPAASETTPDNASKAVSARPTHEEIIAANSVAGSRYSNSVLGLSFEIPSGMNAESAPALKEIEDAGHRAAHGSDPASDPIHQQAQTQTIHLLSVVDRPADRASSPAQILVLAYDLGSERFSNQEIVSAIASGMSAEPGDWQVTEAAHEQQYGGAKF